MAKREHWVEAYRRILAEVREDMPDASEQDVYAEYRARVEVWKHKRGRR